MAIRNAGTGENIRTLTTDPYTFSGGAPTEDPKGVVLAIVHGTESADIIVSVTYGAVSMARQVTQTDTAGEAGRVYLYFLGSGIPTGTQDFVVDLTSDSATDIHFVWWFVGTDDPTTAVHATAFAAANQNEANPTVTPVKGGNVAVGVIANYYGGGAPGTAGANTTQIHTHDFGNFASFVGFHTDFASSVDLSLNVTQVADDEATIGMTVKTVAGGAGPSAGLRTQALTGAGL